MYKWNWVVMKISTIKSNNRNLEYYFVIWYKVSFNTELKLWNIRILTRRAPNEFGLSIITHLKSISFPVRRRSPGNEVAVKCNRLQLKIRLSSFDFLNHTHFNSSEGLPWVIWIYVYPSSWILRKNTTQRNRESKNLLKVFVID